MVTSPPLFTPPKEVVEANGTDYSAVAPLEALLLIVERSEIISCLASKAD
jgi:hypothetical protein